MKYVKLLRVKHYIKNLLIFFPIFFNGSFLLFDKLLNCIYGFIIFCLVSSIVYILNDINDIDIDRKNKKDRPISNGEINKNTAFVIVVVLLFFTILLSIFLLNNDAIFCLIIYLFSNIYYSIFGGKDIPIIDISILCLGFLLRLLYGSIISDIPVSNWLYLTVFSFSFFFSLCKRRNELREDNIYISKRKVLSSYNFSFLDKNMYMFLCMSIVFYSLWSIDSGYKFLVLTVPLISVISLKYSLSVEENSSGDPIEVLFNDFVLCILVVIYLCILFLIIYYNKLL